MKNALLRFWPIIILLLLSGFITWPVFFPGYFSHHDDLQVMRIFEMRKCFADLQIPCRWVPDMGFGNGFPLFNYYGVLAYYIGGVLSYFLGYLGAAKALFFIPLVLGGITMYLLGLELFKSKWAGLTTGVLYLFAPYRALDIWVRGAIAESFAMSMIPLVFYFALRLIRQKTRTNIVGTAVSLGLFLTCHNIMIMYFMPFLILFIVFWLVVEKFKNWKIVLLSSVIGGGISAFFLLPAYLEKNLVQTETLLALGFDFRGHFTSLNQLFLDRSWGYGASVFGINDTLSFQVGVVHWLLAVIAAALALIWLIFKFFKRSKSKDSGIALSLFALFTFLAFGFSVFLTHGKSAFIWEAIPTLQYSQFPWRALSMSVFFSSILGGYLIVVLVSLNRWIAILGVVLVIFLTVFLNWNYFKPEHFYYKLTEQEKLTGVLWRIQQSAGILDYLPKTAQEPKDTAPTTPEVITGKAKISKINVNSNNWNFTANVSQKANIEIPIFDFPNWKVYVNGKLYPHSHQNKLGRIRLDLPVGEYSIRGNLANTTLRYIANFTTFISVAFLIYLVTYGKKLYKNI